MGQAVVAVSTTPINRHNRARILYRDLDVEQLGAVYERVLEYEPSRSATLVRTREVRKSSGTFYTPRSLTGFLVRQTLEPLVKGRSAAEILRLRIVDPAMGSGAFLVAACRYLAEAVERADGCRIGAGGEAARRERRAALRRTVAERCLYGVDLNPTAVQLARLSLWLTTLAADRPLTFLDHHLATGDSLLGASLRDFVRQPPRLKRHRDPDGRALPLFDDDVAAEMASTVLPERLHLALAPSSTAAMVRDKERLLARLGADGTALARWKGAADFWCASWFTRETHSRGVYDDVLAAILAGQGALPERQRHAVTTAATAAAAGARFFHWELEFPEVFHDADGRRRPDGGFDAVLGNPPWDALRADTGDRAARDGAAADRLARLRFFRDSGIYRLQGSGHVNRYQLFLERALQLTRRGGRIGLILPSGLATDQGSAPLRRALLDRTTVERLYGFDNRHLIFPIHRDMRFLLLSATTGARTDGVACAFARSEATWLDGLPDAAAEDPPAARPIALTRRFIERWDPDDLSIPLLRDARDLQIAAHALEIAPALGAAAGWHARFGRELNATEDRRHFVAADTPGARRALRVIHGRDLAPFQLRPDGASPRLPAAAARALLDAATTFGRARLAYRDVASATNRLTLIAARLPAGTVSTHTVFCLKTALDEDDQYCLLALLNSLVANYLVRLQVTTHVTAGLMARLPVPRPEKDPARELAALARSLEVTGLDDVDAYARLNAVVARLYALTPEQYEHIVSTFPLLPAALRSACLSSRRGTETQSFHSRETGGTEQLPRGRKDP
jgi:hypothetical protein